MGKNDPMPPSASSSKQKVAFLRAINVGGRRLKMDALKSHFEDIALKDVETFIASGNVIFTGGGSDTGRLERKIEKALKDVLGFEVATFVRTLPELEKLTKKKPFPRAKQDQLDKLQVGFIAKPASAKARSDITALSNDNDLVTVQGKEVFWLALGGVGRSKVGGAAIEKALGQPTTMRGMKTVHKILTKYA
jgi:uncharacterized protein (DUF1697 family)